MFNIYSIIFMSIISISYKIRNVAGVCEVTNSLGVSPTVKLSSGLVQGLSCQSALDLPYFSFRSIPYAAPPVGDLRFKAPQPPSSWQEVLKADVEAPGCSQPWRDLSYPISYREDCLFINVFTPYLKHPSGKRMPVMVWIHGGKYYEGSGTTYKYGPDFLLEKEVVVVTFNYRLGVFGYLNMNTPGAQGNAGMKDSVLALKWVQREISKFGGDPKLVTIFGGSSGAGVVNMLYLSPMGKGLFSRAISQSGSALCLWNFLQSHYDLGLQLAKALGCQSLTSEDVVVCLRKVDAVELAEKQLMFDGVHGLEVPFIPSLEVDHGEEVFLPAAPHTLLSKAPSIPYIMGTNSGEGLMYVKDPEKIPDQFQNISAILKDNLPSNILEIASPSILKETVSRLQEFYFGTNSSYLHTVYGFVNFMSDKQFIYGILKTAQRMSVQAPLYLYYFNFEGQFQVQTHSYKKLNVTVSGVSHGEELGYFFYRNYILPAHNNLFAYPPDMNLVDKVTTIWTNFAAHGEPTPFTTKQSNSTWIPAEGEFTQFLLIDDDIVMIRKPLLKQRVTLWDSLYSFVFSRFENTQSIINTTTSGTFLLLFCVVFLAIAFVKYDRKHSGYINIK